MGLLQNPHRHDALQGTRLTGRHAASRVFMHNRSSSHQQQHAARSLQLPQRLLPRDSQPPYPPSSPRLQGGDNTLEAAGSAYVLPVPDSSCPHITAVEQHQLGQCSTSDAGQVHAQQGYSQGFLPFVYQQHSQPWSGHAQSTRQQSGAVLDELQHPQQQQQAPKPCVQVPRLALHPSPEAPPPLPPGPPPNAVSAPSHRLQVATAAAASGNRDDSSDSSSSQLASSQRHSTRVLPGILDSGRTGPPVPAGRVDASRAVVRASDDLQQDEVALTQDSGHAARLLYTMTKQQAADAVKALIKPLYMAKALSKDQFKAVAQTCTHALADADRHLGDNIGVHETVCDCLLGMGLNDAAAQL